MKSVEEMPSPMLGTGPLPQPGAKAADLRLWRCIDERQASRSRVTRLIVAADPSVASRVGHNLGVRLSGSPDELTQLAGHGEGVVLALRPTDCAAAAGLTKELVARRVDFRVTGDSLGCFYHLVADLGLPEVPVLADDASWPRRAARVWQRLLDVVTAVILLAVLMPVLLLVGAAVRLESRGTALFFQNRVGRHGRAFRIVKFRSMVRDAQHLQGSMAVECSVDPRFIKITSDPRVTRLGRVLRRTSIDELPQLWNVLRGEMSLVGPRPSQPDEVSEYESAHFERLLVKPGITGMWQVSGRSELCFDEAVGLDIWYVRHWSPWLDLKILVRTVVVVLRCRGAC